MTTRRRIVIFAVATLVMASTPARADQRVHAALRPRPAVEITVGKRPQLKFLPTDPTLDRMLAILPTPERQIVLSIASVRF